MGMARKEQKPLGGKDCGCVGHGFGDDGCEEQDFMEFKVKCFATKEYKDLM